MFRPLNNTILFGTNGYCHTPGDGHDDWTTAACTTWRGGAYDQVASKSRTVPDPDTYPADDKPILFVADDLTLNGTTLANFPMGIPNADLGDQGYVTMSGFGLGPNSSILNTLKSTGIIASRSFGFFWGRDSPNATQLDGSFIFGGYDQEKTRGQKYNFPISTWNPLCPTGFVVSLSNITLNFPNGTSPSIFTSSDSDSITACIDPELKSLIHLPLEPYFSNWLYYTNNSIGEMNRSTGYWYWNMRYPPGVQP